MKLIIINGLPGAGKTLFTEFCKEALLKNKLRHKNFNNFNSI